MPAVSPWSTAVARIIGETAPLLLIGMVGFVARGYPDGFAFAVLLMNILAPTLDRYTPTRVYGTGRRPERP